MQLMKNTDIDKPKIGKKLFFYQNVVNEKDIRKSKVTNKIISSLPS